MACRFFISMILSASTIPNLFLPHPLSYSISYAIPLGRYGTVGEVPGCGG